MNRQYGALSGVAVVLIVLNHAIHFALQVSPVDGARLNVLILLQALGAFAVPAFLFFSGAFLSYSASRLSPAFVRSNLGRILWPYVVWSGVFYLLLLATEGTRYSPQGYVKNLLVGYPYHFVPLLVFWYVAAPAVVKVGRRHGVALLTAISLYQFVLLAIRLPGAFPGGELLNGIGRLVRVPVLFTSMSDWAIYFPLGLVLSMHDAALKPRIFRLRWLAVAATALLFTLGILDAYGIIDEPWARFAAPLPLMFLLPVVDRGAIPLVKAFEFLGKRSYGVYLAHFIFINLIVFLAGRVAFGIPVEILLAAFFVAALALPIGLMHATAALPAGRRVYRHLFGIVPPGSDASRRLPPDVRVPLRAPVSPPSHS